MTEQDDYTLAERMRAATGAFVRAVRQGAGTPSDARLSTLAYLDGRAASAADLARWRGVTHQTMRVLMAQMSKDGLAETAPDPHDGRSVLYSITPAGTTALTRSREARASWIADRWIKDLTPNEKAALRTTLDALDRLLR